MAAQPELRERVRRPLPRIGARKGLSIEDSERAIRGPFEERLSSFLDLLYSDARRAGVTGRAHAQILFCRWLELSKKYDRENGGVLEAFFDALAAFYPASGTVKCETSSGDESFTRKQSEYAMRGPFNTLLAAYLKRIYDPRCSPGIRDAAHARATFVTYCRLVGREPQTTRGRK